MNDLLVLPIIEDDYDVETNTLNLTMFIPYQITDGEIDFISPLDISKENNYRFNPIGFNNFLPKNISHEKMIDILQDMYINNLNYDNDFKRNGEISTFKFNQLPDTIVAYPTEKPDNIYYISVLKIKYNLNNLDFSFDVFNIVKMNNLNPESIINYTDLDLNIDTDKLDLEQKDLHDIALKLQFSTFNEKLFKELNAYVEMYLISQPHIMKN